jgi:TMEM175 potassium channel family protein
MADTHPNTRLETFCDGVFAIALTLLIIDIKIPSSDVIGTSREMWLALRHLVPSIFAFLVSFTIIFITWVNHHAAFRLVNKSSASFIFANGFLLLTVVFMPFPTALVGEYLLTDHAAPAVVIYNSVTAVQAVAWILLSRAALRSQLTKDEKSTVVMRDNRRHGYFAFVVYSVLAVMQERRWNDLISWATTGEPAGNTLRNLRRRLVEGSAPRTTPQTRS